jgi:selenoprotein W-related protein
VWPAAAEMASGDRPPGVRWQDGDVDDDDAVVASPGRRPRVEIEYCTQCRWLPRAAWLAQELLTTFEAEVGEVALVPGRGGVFAVRVDGRLVWDRPVNGFPEPSAVKRTVRDLINPDRDLGHADR